MQVRDVMTRNVISIGSDETVLKAAELMLQNRISGLPVVDAAGEPGRRGDRRRFPAPR